MQQNNKCFTQPKEKKNEEHIFKNTNKLIAREKKMIERDFNFALNFKFSLVSYKTPKHCHSAGEFFVFFLLRK